jgi:hypothetical protein
LGDDFSKAVDEEAGRIQQLKKPAGPNNPELQPYRETYLAKQLESLRVVGKMLQGSRKRKPLVWITGYFPYYVKDGDLTDQQTDIMGTLNSTYQAAIDSLNAARVSVFPVHVTTGDDAVNQPWARDGIADLATRTGYSGKNLYSHSSDNFASVMADLRKHFDSYYMLTLTTQPTRKTNWIDNTVKVNKSDVEITAAKGFFSTPQ